MEREAERSIARVLLEGVVASSSLPTPVAGVPGQGHALPATFSRVSISCQDRTQGRPIIFFSCCLPPRGLVIRLSCFVLSRHLPTMLGLLCCLAGFWGRPPPSAEARDVCARPFLSGASSGVSLIHHAGRWKRQRLRLTHHNHILRRIQRSMPQLQVTGSV